MAWCVVHAHGKLVFRLDAPGRRLGRRCGSRRIRGGSQEDVWSALSDGGVQVHFIAGIERQGRGFAQVHVLLYVRVLVS